MYIGYKAKFATVFSEYDTNLYTRDYYQRFLDDIMSISDTTTVGGCEEKTFNAIFSVFVEVRQ